MTTLFHENDYIKVFQSYDGPQTLHRVGIKWASEACIFFFNLIFFFRLKCIIIEDAFLYYYTYWGHTFAYLMLVYVADLGLLGGEGGGRGPVSFLFTLKSDVTPQLRMKACILYCSETQFLLVLLE